MSEPLHEPAQNEDDDTCDVCGEPYLSNFLKCSECLDAKNFKEALDRATIEIVDGPCPCEYCASKRAS